MKPSTEINDGWAIYEDGVGEHRSVRLLVEERWDDRFFRIIKERHVSTLHLADWRGDLEFVRKLSSYLTGLIVDGDGSEDLAPITSLVKLRVLSVGGRIAQVDFEALRNLEDLCISSQELEGNFSNCSWLRKLNIGNLRLQGLEPLSKLSRLEELNVGNRSLKRLDGLGHLKRLRKLTLGGMHWKSLDGIESARRLTECYISDMPRLLDGRSLGLLKNLTKLTLRNCKLLRDIRFASNLANLKYLELDGYSAIESISPLQCAKRLRVFLLVGTGKIIDGNLGGLLEMPEVEFVAFRDWKHYSHSEKEIRAELASRGIRMPQYATDVNLA